MSFLASFCDGISIVSYIILAAKTVIKMMTENLVNPSCQKTTKYFWLNNSIIIGCIRYIENDIAPIFTRLGNSKETPDFSSSDKEVTRPKQGIAHCQKNAFCCCHAGSLSFASAFAAIISSFCERDVANV